VTQPNPGELEETRELKPVTFWYILLLTSFSLGTSAVTVCLTQAVRQTADPYHPSAMLVGILTSLMSLNQIWVTPYAAWKSDRIWTRFGRRRPVVLAMGPILVLFILVIPFCTSLWMLFTVVFILTLAQSSQLALITPSIGDAIPDKQRPLATAMWQFIANGLAIFIMSRYMLGLMDPGSHQIGPKFLNVSVQGAGYWPYVIAAGLFLITSAVYLKVMRERYVPPRPADKFRLFSYGKQIVQLREHTLAYVVLLFQPLFVLVGSWYFKEVATKDLNMTMGDFGKAFSWGAIATMVTCIPLGYLFNRFKHRKAMTIAACLMALVPTTYGLYFMHSAAGMGFFFAAQQIAFAVFRLNFIPYVMEYTTPKSVGTILGFTNSVNGIVRFFAVWMFGCLIDIFGKNYRLPLYGAYVGIIVCIICVMAMRPPEKVRRLLDDQPD